MHHLDKQTFAPPPPPKKNYITPVLIVMIFGASWDTLPSVYFICDVCLMILFSTYPRNNRYTVLARYSAQAPISPQEETMHL